MKLLPLLPLLPLASATDYFLRYTPTSLTPSTVPSWLTTSRLRTNGTLSPNLPAPPYNPADHFARFTPSSPSDPYTPLVVVATNPHPPPVPGYLGLSDKDGVADGYRAVESWRVEEEGPGFLYKEWLVQEVKGGRCKPGRKVLRYKPVGGGAWGWYAVKEGARWVPWYIKKSPANAATLATWEYVSVDIELVVATGPVNSNAPGGVEE